MKHQIMAGEHIKEVQQAEIDRLNDANAKEESEAARDQENLKKHQDNMKENLKLDHERIMEKERLKHQGETEKLKGEILRTLLNLQDLNFILQEASKR